MRVLARAAAVLAATATSVLLVTGTAGATTAPEHDPVFTPAAGTASALVTKLTHSQASTRLRSSGITWSSSGNCSDRSKPNCTSFDQVNLTTIQGAQTLKSATGCALNVTGGTEVGHASGTYSHYNGYKLDFALSSCLTNYIKGTFTAIGGNQWRSGSGNIYYLESNHWDVTYYNCGGC
ncbi:hypothetical protein [Actinokineospora diospyrosa]|uniref:Uncharacterized protein n=1 Tax=Actinokineospora diospyrosa TaxID=103728 RepID=A0ABT1I6Q5_9PSEU|nr:hypothetical protein [Actinokineospora diospyrosa]MCP2268313.1 hypothetical protein [Actinokineospora diospyrosa]